MTRSQDLPIRQMLGKLFPAVFLAGLAKATAAVKRVRKVDPVDLFWTVVLGFGVGRERSIAGLRRGYEKTTGKTIEESSFYDRFSEGFTQMLKQAAVRALEQSMGCGRALRGHLAAFRDVVLTDSTVVRLHDLLKRDYAGSRTNHSKAALKAHWIMAVGEAGQHSVRITAGRRHDGPVFRVGKWVAGKLLIFDLGYFSYHLFDCITRNHGYFLSRLKANANPTIVACNNMDEELASKLVGKRMKDVTDILAGATVDVTVEVEFKRRRCGARRRAVTRLLRVVGARDKATGAYHLYMTNVPVDRLPAQDVQTTYALRWQIELLFKELKRHYHLEEMPSAKRQIVEALLHAAIITLAVSRTLLQAVRQRLGALAERTPTLRWGAVLASVASDLLAIVLGSPNTVRALAARISTTILHEAVDPNASRPQLLQAVETRTHAYRVRTPRKTKSVTPSRLEETRKHACRARPSAANTLKSRIIPS